MLSHDYSLDNSRLLFYIILYMEAILSYFLRGFEQMQKPVTVLRMSFFIDDSNFRMGTRSSASFFSFFTGYASYNSS